MGCAIVKLHYLFSFFLLEKAGFVLTNPAFFSYWTTKNGFVSKIAVCLNRCDSYDIQVLQPAIQEQLDLLDVPAELSAKKILLKPNLISAGAPPLACSSPLFVAAVAACFLARGAKVQLGDSPAFGTAAQVLERQGFHSVFSGLAVDCISFHTRVVKTLNCGIRIGVAAEALDCDYFVNLPRIKAHEQMGTTMAVKNVFGIVLGARKAWLHMRHGESHQLFAQMILDLQQLLPSALVLADGIEVMTRRGPMKGDPLSLGCLAASKSAVALDRAMLEVLEIDKNKVPLALVAAKEKLGGSRMADLEFPQLMPEAFAGSGFTIPATLTPVRFQPFRYLRNSLKRMLSL
jgi:uncharacterized protein (DUF362 family)